MSVEALKPSSLLSVGDSSMEKANSLLVFDNDSRAMPFPRIQEVLDFLPYASPVRVMFRMLFLTGCRISELESFHKSTLRGQWIYWRLGKNQGSYRKEWLPMDYLVELNVYRTTHRCYEDRLFHMKAKSFVRRFNQTVRPKLSPAWRERRLKLKNNLLVPEYVLQLNGLRKTFQTYAFWHEYKRYNDAYVAMEMVSKRMKHSTKHITAHHYIQNFEALDVERFTLEKPIFEVLDQGNQMSIIDYTK